ncbi:hypothetical protein BRE01_48560 [Brevibacillus reuszeri]|uniref:Uncharacterized protein n=1 Tax=Brevibacillus reuszeri TaxID=54915 RepID=A0A0K9YZY6_9BACL|nr:hypothetical protein [Brevibacillus reuszeri]KNB73785.1 hypothetical protein ADS79_07575 [Brevibacillus reuszeri]MED1861697.1 hypothetical protein [Brevibacillus reuszeri]GED71154.1 hypothetical protein BRE01_48560 [Brevibacillus reuszeri]
MKKASIIALTLGTILTGCSAATSESVTPATVTTATSAPTPAPEVKAMSADEVNRFKEYATKLKGGTFITEAEIVNQNEAIITYADYDSLKKSKPDSTITKDDFNGYWGSGDAVNKTLMEEPIRLLREFPELNKVKLTLNHEKAHLIEVDRATTEDYFKVNLSEIHADKSNEKWRNEIVNKFFTKDERKKYIEKFVK